MLLLVFNHHQPTTYLQVIKVDNANREMYIERSTTTSEPHLHMLATCRTEEGSHLNKDIEGNLPLYQPYIQVCIYTVKSVGYVHVATSCITVESTILQVL